MMKTKSTETDADINRETHEICSNLLPAKKYPTAVVRQKGNPDTQDIGGTAERNSPRQGPTIPACIALFRKRTT